MIAGAAPRSFPPAAETFAAGEDLAGGGERGRARGTIMIAMRMIRTAGAAVVAAIIAGAVIAGVAGCAPAVVAPVTVGVNDLQGATVKVGLKQIVNIDTGDLPVDSYSAEIADPTILQFVQGRDDGSATFNPGLTPLAVGTTEVTMTNAQGGIQALKFTVVVTE